MLTATVSMLGDPCAAASDGLSDLNNRLTCGRRQPLSWILLPLSSAFDAISLVSERVCVFLWDRCGGASAGTDTAEMGDNDIVRPERQLLGVGVPAMLFRQPTAALFISANAGILYLSWAMSLLALVDLLSETAELTCATWTSAASVSLANAGGARRRVLYDEE